LEARKLKHFGLDPHKVTELVVKVHAHSVQYAYKFVVPDALLR